MPEIVINTCYGGFSLSPAAVKRLAELNGKECYFLRGGVIEPYVHCDDDLSILTWDGVFWSAFSVPDPNVMKASLKACTAPPGSEERDRLLRQWKAMFLDRYVTNPRDRADPKLIQVVKELGKKASHKYSELKIVEIPDGIDWEIVNRDGKEFVREASRVWS